MNYRVLFWLGVSVAFGIRVAKSMIAMASKLRRVATRSVRKPSSHAVRHLRGGALVQTPTLGNAQQTGGKLLKVEKLPPPGPVCDRVHSVDLYIGKLLLGVLWVYLYSEKKIARRVFKVHDRHLASAVGFSRYYYQDVPYDAANGVEEIVKAFHGEVSKQLDQRMARADKARAKERQQQDAVKKEAVQQKPIQKSSAVPVTQPPKASAATSVGAPELATEASASRVHSVAAPEHRRQVKGDAVIGSVASAGMTKKVNQDGSSYSTYCLTIHDGDREVPFFGQELARQVGDLNIQPGEKIQVVFMGKQSIPMEGKPPRFKNLYQITRVHA
jgi:hypothetical protein